jgi:flavodoxin
MARVILVYESKYGNTKLVAERIASGRREDSGIEVVIGELKEADLNQLADYDAILVGSPNHIGNATRGIRKFIDRLGKAELQGKMIAAFDTYMGKDYEKAMKKMEKQISKKASDLELVTPGLSIRVDGMKGPITEAELPKCKEFGVSMASQVNKLARD